jgi:hypothetical protein
MKLKRVNVNVAKFLKEIGYNEICTHYYEVALKDIKNENDDRYSYPKGYVGLQEMYHKNIDIVAGVDFSNEYWELYSAPTLEEVRKYFRDAYKYDVNVSRNLDGWDCVITEFSQGNKHIRTCGFEYDDYDVTLEAGIIIMLNMISNKLVLKNKNNEKEIKN